MINVNTFKGYALGSLDGDIGTVSEFYFDDRFWGIRYLVADTGNWLVGRRVLITPHQLRATDVPTRHVAVNLTKDQIEKSPSLDSDKPVSRQFEKDYYGYYMLPVYWGGPYMWGSYPHVERDAVDDRTTEEIEHWDPNLRSSNEVTGYTLHTENGEIGHIDDFILDEDAWVIRYLVVDTGKWWPGKKILIAPAWITGINQLDSSVTVSLTTEAIKESPVYTEDAPIDRVYEQALYRYYKRSEYWTAVQETGTTTPAKTLESIR
jgi:hypothetical protein